MPPYFVSFNPDLPLDENLSIFGSTEAPEVQALLHRAAGVLLPGYVTPWRYRAITRHARAWFPRLEARFHYNGKIRQIALFRQLGVRHPESRLFANRAHLRASFGFWGSPWGCPFVLKGDKGGGGSGVFPVYEPGQLPGLLERIPAQDPVLIQRWVEHGGKDLRVVVYGSELVSYFRVGGGQFYNNACRGGHIDHSGWPELRQRGESAVKRFCERTGIDIAGFDLMFPDAGAPVFVEINFHFGRKGLGGTPGHRQHLRRAVERWRQQCLKA